MKLLSVVGTRPQFIKLAAMDRVLRNKSIEHLVVHTGQHYDANMSEIHFNELQISAKIVNLQVKSKRESMQVADMISKLAKCLNSIDPSAVLTYGDTNSTLSGAIACSKEKIPFVHIEAGLRSNDKTMSEEINRIITDHIANLNFAPTKNALKNLVNEGLAHNSYFTGDIMFDLFKQLSFLEDVTEPRTFLLATLHRPFNVDSEERLFYIISQLTKCNLPIVLLLHPRTKKSLNEFKIKIGKNVQVYEPRSYFNILKLLKQSKGLITDSGGLQKEAFFLQKPTLTLRKSTEWVETVESGLNILDFNMMLLNEFHLKVQKSTINNQNFYGDGHASEYIIDLIESKLSL